MKGKEIFDMALTGFVLLLGLNIVGGVAGLKNLFGGLTGFLGGGNGGTIPQNLILETASQRVDQLPISAEAKEELLPTFIKTTEVASIVEPVKAQPPVSPFGFLTNPFFQLGVEMGAPWKQVEKEAVARVIEAKPVIAGSFPDVTDVAPEKALTGQQYIKDGLVFRIGGR